MTDILPRNVEAEAALIASTVMLGYIPKSAEPILADRWNFSDERNREFWSKILLLASRGDPIDTISLIAALKGSTIIDENEATAILAGYVGSVPSSLSVDKYAELVRVVSAKRKLAVALNKVAKICHGDGMFDPGAVFSEAIAEIESAANGIQPMERETWTLGELVALEVPEDPWILDGLLIQGGLNLLAGEFGAGKTFMSLDLAIGAASEGGLVWGRKVKPSSVLYFGADNSRSNLVRRSRALSAGRGITPKYENLIFDLSPLKLSEPAGIATVRHAVLEHKADLVIFDALIRYLGDYDENSSSDIGRMMADFRAIANMTGCTFVLVHHLRKLSGQVTKAKISDRIRGSGDFLGAVDSALVLSIKGEGPNIIRTLVHVKTREGRESEAVSLEIQDSEKSGLVLTFGLGDSALAAETLAETALAAMLSKMQKEPGVSFTKKDLRDILDDAGLNISSRTEDDTFSMIRNIPNVQISKVGRFNNYQWIESEK